MQRYFSIGKDDNGYLLRGDDAYHIKKVMRMKIGDLIEVVDNKITYICKINSFEPLKVEIVKKLEEDNESKIKITLVQSLVNEQKMDYILQKCTELGVSSFYAYKASNSVIKENDKSNKKIIRWQRIVKESAEQSKRNIIPEVVDIIGINELIKLKADVKLLLTVNEKSKMLKNVLQQFKSCDTMIIVVGPEGGFTNMEEKILVDNGFISVSIGKTVLRTETAGVATLSMTNYEWMV